MNRRIFAVGEALIDFIPVNNKETAFTGGAPLNFVGGAIKYNPESYFVSNFANDDKSKLIQNTMQKYDISAKYITFADKFVTGYSKVSYDEKHNRCFTFEKENASFLDLRESLKIKCIKKNDIFYFGSVIFLSKTNIKAMKTKLKELNKLGTVIVFDPNVRLSLFKENKIKAIIRSFLKYVDIVKISDDELPLISGKNGINQGIDLVFAKYSKIKMIVYTKGKDGSEVFLRDAHYNGKSYNVKAIDNVGCGDIFCGTFIGLLSLEKDLFKNKNFEKILKEANKQAALNTLHVGCLI